MWLWNAMSGSDSNLATPGATGDASAEIACQNFQSLAADAGNGVLTGPELRDRLQGVYDDAKYSDTPGIADAATHLLQDATAGDTSSPDFRSAIDEMGHACVDAGF